MVYFFEVAPGVVKIGYSKESPNNRYRTALCWCGSVKVLCVLPDANRADEKMIHYALDALRVYRGRELFRLTDELRSLCVQLCDGRDWHTEVVEMERYSSKKRRRKPSATTPEIRAKRREYNNEYRKRMPAEQLENRRAYNRERYANMVLEERRQQRPQLTPEQLERKRARMREYMRARYVKLHAAKSVTPCNT